MAAPAIKLENSAGHATKHAPLVVWYFTIVLATVALLAPTTSALLATWLSSPTYIHGAIAFALALGLVWIRRDALTATKTPPAAVAALIMAACLAFWLIASANDNNFFAQLAFVLTLIAAFGGLFGLSTLKAFAAPLGVLFFAIPLGDGLLPPLQTITAEIARGLLDAAGIQYGYDHPYFTTTAARFHISEACSGMNFVSMALLAAYLLSIKYRLPLRRALMLLAGAAILALLMNGLRAFGVIAGVTLARDGAGFAADHLWLGLALFVPVLIVLGAIAARLAPAGEDMRPPPIKENPTAVVPPIRNFLFMLCALTLFSGGALFLRAT